VNGDIKTGDDLLEELLVRDSRCALFRLRFLGKKLRELLVEGDQILGILPPFEFILEHKFSAWLSTALKTTCRLQEGNIRPSTENLNHLPNYVGQGLDLNEFESPWRLLAQIMGIVHGSVHALTSLGRMCVASIASNEYALRDRELSGDPLSN
jgi:hypothetical protein